MSLTLEGLSKIIGSIMV